MTGIMTRAAARVTLVLFGAGLLGGCGYHLRGKQNQFLADRGVRTIYVAPIVNDTFKVGVDNLVYNELIQTISAHRQVSLVPKPELADAILEGTVQTASYRPGGKTKASELFPLGRDEEDLIPESEIPLTRILVATQYVASLRVSFVLKRNRGPKKDERIWSGAFERRRPFPAVNQLGVFGNTSPLINDSEFDRSLGELAENMMADLHESMLAMF